MLVLVTGATGKVGRHFINRFLAAPKWEGARVRALYHKRRFPDTHRVEPAFGSIADRDACARAMSGVSHVVHLATCKETPDDVIDVTVKGLFWLLEEFRTSATARQFILVGGDAAVGHFFYRHAAPITESTPHMAYPGCYALSKVLEEVVLEQFGVQYDLNGCCLRAPWIMEKDDFRHTLSFGDDVFGGPDWRTMVAKEDAERGRREGAAPLLRDAGGVPLKRNFVHVDDLASAMLAALDNPRAKRQLYNVCMDRPVDYGEVAAYLKRTRGLSSIDIPSNFHSNWMDNSKAKYHLAWAPAYDLEKLIDSAWEYQRSPEDPRRVWYPG